MARRAYSRSPWLDVEVAAVVLLLLQHLLVAVVVAELVVGALWSALIQRGRQ